MVTVLIPAATAAVARLNALVAGAAAAAAATELCPLGAAQVWPLPGAAGGGARAATGRQPGGGRAAPRWRPGGGQVVTAGLRRRL